VQGAEASFVHRDRRIDEAPHRVHHARQGLRERRVDGPPRLGRRATEVHVDAAVPSGHGDIDLELAIGIDAVTVDLERAVVRARGEPAQVVAHAPFGIVDRIPDETLDRRRAKSFDELLHPPGDDVHARDEGSDVADHLVRCTAVAGDDAQHVVHGLTIPVQMDRRQQQAFGERVGGERREPGHRVAAEVGDVDEGAGKEHDPAVAENGPEHQDVVGVDATAIGIVQGEDVTRPHRIEWALLEQ
jgi:hypothetical protein